MQYGKKPPNPGKKLIFRWWYIHPVTKKKIIARHRPFPIWVDA